MFKAQHTGDSVRVAIPYAAILDVEKSTAMDFSETIEVKVVDQVNSFEVDSYFFAYLPNLGVALEQIREAVRSHREHGGFSGGSGTKARGLSMPLPVMDTTQTPRSPAGSTIPLGQSPNMKVTGLPTTSSPIGETDQGAPRPSAISRLSSLWQRTPAATAPASSKILQSTTEESESASNHEEFTHINKRGESSFVPVTMTTSPGMMSKDLPPVETATSPEARLDSSSHTYPPSPTPSETLAETSMAPNSGSALGNWGVGMPSWLRIARPASGMNQQRASSDRNDKDRDKERMSTGEMLRHATGSSTAVSAMMGPTGLSMGSGGHELGYSVLETPGLSVDGEMQEKFRATFALGEEEALLGCKYDLKGELLPGG
jgi:sterol 3beta-glucosyltransferase